MAQQLKALDALPKVLGMSTHMVSHSCLYLQFWSIREFSDSFWPPWAPTEHVEDGQKGKKTYNLKTATITTAEQLYSIMNRNSRVLKKWEILVSSHVKYGETLERLQNIV